MGADLTKSVRSFFKRKRAIGVLMLGLDAAGKTTILYRLKYSTSVVATIPTIGFNVETVEFEKLKFTVWDVGGQDRSRKLWSHYFRGNEGIIFVIDSTDVDRLAPPSTAMGADREPLLLAGEKERTTAKDEIEYLMTHEELQGLPLLVLANKQDLPSALSSEEISSRLDLQRLDQQSRKWHVQPTCASSGQGLAEGFHWLSEVIG